MEPAMSDLAAPDLMALSLSVVVHYYIEAEVRAALYQGA